MIRLTYMHGKIVKTVWILSIAALVAAAIVSILQLDSQQSMVSGFLTLGALSGPIAEYLGQRSYLSQGDPISSSCNRKYLIARFKFLILLIVLVFVGVHSVFFILMLRLSPSPLPRDADIEIQTGLLLNSIIISLVCWLIVRSIINIIDPKPRINVRCLKIRNIQEGASR